MNPVDPSLDSLLRATITLLVIVDPAGLIPLVMGLTKGMKEDEMRSTLRTAVLSGSVLLILFAIAGQELLLLFGITLYSFMIAGGILLLLLAMRMLVLGEFVSSSSAKDEVGVVPIAFPLLVGPGAITATIVTLQTSGIIVALVSIAIVMSLTWLAFRYIRGIESLLGSRGSAVLSKLMAIFIAAIAVQYVLTGIQFYYPP